MAASSETRDLWPENKGIAQREILGPNTAPENTFAPGSDVPQCSKLMSFGSGGQDCGTFLSLPTALCSTRTSLVAEMHCKGRGQLPSDNLEPRARRFCGSVDGRLAPVASGQGPVSRLQCHGLHKYDSFHLGHRSQSLPPILLFKNYK